MHTKGNGFDRDNLQQRLARNQAFWDRTPVERPLLGTAAGITFPFVRFSDKPVPVSEGRITPDMIDPKQFLADWDRTYEYAEARREDMFMVASPFDGMPWMEAIAGCEVYVSLKSRSVWAEHPDPSWDSLKGIRFDPKNPWLLKILEYSDTLREHADGRYPIGNPILRGVADMAEALLGTQRMVFEYFDHPQEMRDLLARCTEIWQRVGDMLIEAFGTFHGGMCAGRRRAWGKGTCMIYQEDAASMLSPSLYQDFILPQEDEILRGWDRAMIHIHSGTLPVVIDGLLSLDSLDAMEILIDPTGGTLPELLDTFRHLQEHKSVLICGEISLDETMLILKELSPQGLAIISKVDMEEDANVRFRQVLSYLDAGQVGDRENSQTEE